MGEEIVRLNALIVSRDWAKGTFVLAIIGIDGLGSSAATRI